jgi:hypothetical protein
MRIIHLTLPSIVFIASLITYHAPTAAADNEVKVCATGEVSVTCVQPPDYINSTLLLRRAGTLERTRVRLRQYSSNGSFFLLLTGLKAGTYVAKVGNTRGFFHQTRSNGRLGKFRFYREDVTITASKFTSTGPSQEIPLSVRVSDDRRCEVLGRPRGCFNGPI